MPGSLSLDIHVLVHRSHTGEQWWFTYTDMTKGEMLRTLGAYAADPRLSFSWYDAAVLARKIRAADPEGKL